MDRLDLGDCGMVVSLDRNEGRQESGINDAPVTRNPVLPNLDHWWESEILLVQIFLGDF